MTRRAILYCILGLVGLAFRAEAKPISTYAAKFVPRLRQLAAEARNGKSLSFDDRSFLAECMNSDEPVLVSASAWIIGEDSSEDTTLFEKLRSRRQPRDDMSAAFITLALEKKSGRVRNQNWMPNRSHLADPNPIMRIEVVRAILHESPDEGQALLEKMIEEDSGEARILARDLLMHFRDKLKTPYIIEPYGALMSIVDG